MVDFIARVLGCIVGMLIVDGIRALTGKRRKSGRK